jgi:hypothetical protein
MCVVFFAGHCKIRKLKWFSPTCWDVVTLSSTSEMHLLVKFQGFKNLRTTEQTIQADPSDTIAVVADKLGKIAGVPADKLTVMTGLVISSPSDSFKKLDKNGTVSDHGLRHGSTLMVFIPVGQQDSCNTIAAPAPIPQDTRRKVCVGKAEYRSSASEPLKSGNIMAVVGETNHKKRTILLFNGIEYANAQEWMSKAFSNSGRSCAVKIEQSQTVGDTPRPTRYVPPSDKCPFGRYV